MAGEGEGEGGGRGWQRICHTINPCRSIGSRSLVRSAASRMLRTPLAIAMKQREESRDDDGEEEGVVPGRARERSEK